jgi:hypothetical protein
MRRRGIAVRLVTDLPTPQVAALLLRLPVSAAFVSVGSDASRERVPDLLRLIRAKRNRPMPLVVGGAGARSGKAITGADFVAADLGEALGFCRLPLHLDAGVAYAPHG